MRVQITFDCADPVGLARFWAALLGYEPDPPPGGYATWDDYLRSIGLPEEEWNTGYSIHDPAGERPRIFFQQVPEPKTVKNRLHLDLGFAPRDAPPEERRRLIDEQAVRAESLGARRIGGNDEYGYSIIMQDPEGNEFCLH